MYIFCIFIGTMSASFYMFQWVESNKKFQDKILAKRLDQFRSATCSVSSHGSLGSRSEISYESIWLSSGWLGNWPLSPLEECVCSVLHDFGLGSAKKEFIVGKESSFMLDSIKDVAKLAEFCAWCLKTKYLV